MSKNQIFNYMYCLILSITHNSIIFRLRYGRRQDKIVKKADPFADSPKVDIIRKLPIDITHKIFR